MMNDAAEAVSTSRQATQPLRNACGGAVQGESPKWYVAVVKPRYERICRDELHDLGHEAYIASQTDTRLYACRHRRQVERIIIPNIVFVHTTEPERRQMLRESNFIHHFMTDRAAQSPEHGHQPFAIIPEAQMEMLRFMLYHADRPVEFTTLPYQPGDRIRVIRGELQGFEGDFVRQGAQSYAIVTLGSLGTVKATIPVADIECISHS